MRFPYRLHVLACAGPRCGAEHGEALKGELKRQLPDRKALGIRIGTSSCQGLCSRGPNLTVHPEGVVYHRLSVEDVERIVLEHLRGGHVVEDLAADPGDNCGEEKEEL